MENNNSGKAFLVIVLLIVVMIGAITTGYFLSKENGNKDEEKASNTVNTQKEEEQIKDNNSEKEKLKIGTYYWVNAPEDMKEGILSGMCGDTIEFNENDTFNYSLGNGGWIDGKWSQDENEIILKDISFNSEWSNEPEEVNLQVKFEYNGYDTIEVKSVTGNVNIHLIDMVTGEKMEETKEMLTTGLEKGDIYVFEDNIEFEE